MNNQLSRTLFLLKNQLGNRSALRMYRQLRREETLQPEELKALNWRRRKQIVHWAWEEVPYYRETWNRIGFHPDQLQTQDDWQRVPILRKQELRTAFERLKAESLPKSRGKLSTTGGSTGQPIKVLFDTKVPLEAFAWQVLDWWRIHPADNVGYCFRMTRKGWRRRFNQFIWWPTRRDFLDASAMTSDSIKIFLSSIARHHSKLLQGYVGAVHEVAQQLHNENRTLSSIRAVWVTSSPITLSQRKFIQEAFQAPVYDQYGCGEVFWLACECERGEGLHAFHSNRHLEFLDEMGRTVEDESFGDIHITDLNNRVFPIIRYANGDRGRWLNRSCDCGRTLPLMAPVKGRISDTLTMPSGRRIAGDFLTTIFDHAPDAVNSFQIHQDKDGYISLRCVPHSTENSTQVMEEVRSRLSEISGTEVKLEVHKKISHDGGKTRFIISEFKK